ncbi:hypothetical protein ES703_55370 [subsurface metagenome]
MKKILTLIDKKVDQLKNNGERYLELTPGEYEALKNNLILKELKNNSDILVYRGISIKVIKEEKKSYKEKILKIKV